MRIAITGSNGMIGSYLCNYLPNKLNAQIIRIPRQLLYGTPQALAEFIDGSDVIIHLSGASILTRWTLRRKKILYSSRVDTTKQLYKALSLLEKKPKQFISTSAVGIYDTASTHSEESNFFANDFLGQLCKDWELAAFQMRELGVATTVFRLGVILSNKGGMLKRIIPLFKMSLGGNLGSGKQMLPFIHIHDLVSAYAHVISKKSDGIYNLVAPDLINNNDFTIILGERVNKPTFLHIPEIVLKLVLGEASCILLTGQTVLPKRLKNEGFEFKYLTLKEAVDALT